VAKPGSRPQDRDNLAYILTLFGLIGQLCGKATDNVAPHQESLALFRATGNQAGEALTLYWLADTLRMQHRDDATQPYYQQSQQVFRQLDDPWGIALSLQGLGAVAYRQGDYAAARAWLEECLALRRPSGDKWLTAQTLNTLATTLQAQGEHDTAARHFTEACALYREVGDAYGRMYALFKLGELAQAQADVAAATRHFQDCLALAEVVKHPRRIAQCQAALAALAAATPAVAATTHPHLAITAFGSGQVRRADGTTVASSEWGYARVKELFFYLLDRGPQTKAQIGLAFWPDASPARLRRNLHDTLYQLRRALGDPKWIVYENGRYVFNPSLPHSYDVADFTDLLRSQALPRLQRAIALYRADFLAEFDSEWCLLRRERLRQQFLAALLALGGLMLEDGRYAAAADVYRRTILHDNLLETAHRELMRCYARLGEPGRAIRHYQQLCTLLQDELGVDPAPETTTLYHRLQQGEPV
jgi:DNA-binding SARP family transcriptional activator